ncbi:MAG TPA: hypothetical protein VEA69_22240 [Tepidisphaeraceae bacterium]|nr:hypothetical protein [Tepidisphaeraceae bacterium]
MNTRLTNFDRPRRRGVSLVMVTALVATASVMAMAVLSNSTLQATASAGQTTVVQADALAESAMNKGLYYLQNVDNAKCPATIAAMGTYTENDQTLGNSVDGKFHLVVKGVGTGKWEITATGIANATSGPITRKLVSTVEANYFGYALAFGPTGSPALPADVTVTGDVYAPAAITNNGTINGVLYGGTPSNNGAATAVKSVSSLLVTPLPSRTQANHYAISYTFSSKTGSRAQLPSNNLTNVTLGPTLLNPAGVYYYSSDVTFNGNVKINGTLVLNTPAKLKIKGAGNAITAQTGTPAVPALVCDSDVQFVADGGALDVTGLAWLGGKVTKSGTTGTTCQLNITGALLAYDGTALDAGVPTTITYNRAKASVPSFWLNLTRPPPPTSLTVLNWAN